MSEELRDKIRREFKHGQFSTPEEVIDTVRTILDNNWPDSAIRGEESWAYEHRVHGGVLRISSAGHPDKWLGIEIQSEEATIGVELEAEDALAVGAALTSFAERPKQ